MLRDTTGIDWHTGYACAYLPDNDHLILYDITHEPTTGGDGSGSTTYYSLINERYTINREVTQTISPKPEGVICTDVTQVQAITSKYDFIVPIYNFMAILSVILIVYCAYKLIIYPFFRKKVL